MRSRAALPVALAVALCALAQPRRGAGSETPPPPRPPHHTPVPRPPRHVPAPRGNELGCEEWEGVASGNDPGVSLRARLCPSGAGGAVSGTVVWSSATSGTHRREVDGAWDGAHAVLVLHDVRLIDEQPRPGWVFCLIERYELRVAGEGRLEGTYDSSACRDHAVVTLVRAR